MLTGTGDLGLPPGQRRAAAHPVIAELNPAECRQLLAPGGVGRFLFVADRGPVAVPVNYGMLGGDIVFRTSESGRVAGGHAGRLAGVVQRGPDRRRPGRGLECAGQRCGGGPS